MASIQFNWNENFLFSIVQHNKKKNHRHLFIYHDLFGSKNQNIIIFDQMNWICMHFFFCWYPWKLNKISSWFVERRKECLITISNTNFGKLFAFAFFWLWNSMEWNLLSETFRDLCKTIIRLRNSNDTFHWNIEYVHVQAVPIIQNDSSKLTSCHNIHVKIRNYNDARLLWAKPINIYCHGFVSFVLSFALTGENRLFFLSLLLLNSIFHFHTGGL